MCCGATQPVWRTRADAPLTATVSVASAPLWVDCRPRSAPISIIRPARTGAPAAKHVGARDFLKAGTSAWRKACRQGLAADSRSTSKGSSACTVRHTTARSMSKYPWAIRLRIPRTPRQGIPGWVEKVRYYEDRMLGALYEERKGLGPQHDLAEMPEAALTAEEGETREASSKELVASLNRRPAALDEAVPKPLAVEAPSGALGIVRGKQRELRRAITSHREEPSPTELMGGAD